MKKIIDKKLIIGFILGGIVFSSITAFAITICSSDNVTYQKGEEQVSLTNAIDDLYSKTSSSGNLKIIKIQEEARNSTSVNVKNICEENGIDYTKLTEDNFFVDIVSAGGSGITDTVFHGQAWRVKSTTSSKVKTYNPSTGDFTYSITPSNYAQGLSSAKEVIDDGSFETRYLYAYLGEPSDQELESTTLNFLTTGYVNFVTYLVY